MVQRRAGDGKAELGHQARAFVEAEDFQGLAVVARVGIQLQILPQEFRDLNGIDAARLMGITKKVISIRATNGELSPYQVLCQVNNDLVGDFNKYNFSTALYGILHLPSGRFTFARAGHEVPLMFSPNYCQAVESKGIPLGIDTGTTFCHMLEEKTVELRRGSFLLLCTDGLAECMNNRGSSYTRERLQYALRDVREDATAVQFLEEFLHSIQEFAGGRSQEDDMTAIVVQRNA